MPASLFERICFILGFKRELELELISYADMYLFFEGMRDEVCYISKRYDKANNNVQNRMTKKKLKHIICLDENNLYDKKISKFPPLIRFEWINPTSAIV